MAPGLALPLRYNIAPSQPLLAVRVEHGSPRFALLRWGLVPSWAKDPAMGQHMINARGETVAVKPAFKNAYRHHRCLIPASGFYEWAHEGKGRQPYYFSGNRGTPLAMAGLWEHWLGPDGSEMETCAIVTTQANKTLKPIHDRMPVLIPRERFAAWLDHSPGAWTHAAELLVPSPEDALVKIKVSTYVNHPAHEGPACLAPAK